MAAILRSGKFLRLVSGFARQPQQQQQPQAFPGPFPHQPSPSSKTQDSNGHLANVFDPASPFQAWSLQHLNTALPAVSATVIDDDEDDDDDDKVVNSYRPHHVTRGEIESLVGNIPNLDPKIALSHSVLVLRLCGKVLQSEMPDQVARTDFVNSIWTRLEEEMKVGMTAQHYNALLSVYLENDHKFCPDYVQKRLKAHGISADREMMEAFLERYCLDGNLEGANGIVKSLQDRNHTLSSTARRSLFLCLAKSGDLNGARAMLKQHQPVPSGSFQALCRGFAHRGDLAGVEWAVGTAVEHGMQLSTKDLFEIVVEMTQCRHKETASKVLRTMVSKSESSYEKEAKVAVMKLVSSGNEDVAFTILQTVQTSSSAKEFLEHLVKAKRPISKLLWFAEEMNRLNILKGGFEILLQTALHEDNFPLSLKLAEIYVQDGHDFEISDLPSSLLRMCSSSLDVLSSVKALGGRLTEEEVKDVVIPKIREFCCQNDSAQELWDNVSRTGLRPELAVRPVVDFLLGQSGPEEARVVATANRHFLREDQMWLTGVMAKEEEEQTRHEVEMMTTVHQQMMIEDNNNQAAEAAYPQSYTAMAMVQVFDPVSQSFQYCPLPLVCDHFLAHGRYWDLEQLLDTSLGSYTHDDRRSIFLYTLQAYAGQGMYDKAAALTARLQHEGLAYNFPEYHMNYARLAAESALSSSSLSAVPSSSGVSSTAPSTCPPTPASEEEEQLQLQAYYHKALKRSINDKNSDGALRAYRELRKTGKPLNVTEASSLIELLVKADHVQEAARLAESMLRRDTYPMPKIFRYLLNKLAANGEVELMNSVGRHLCPKVKKEVSFDNRLCNAYLSAGKAAEFLDLLEREVASVRPANLQSVKDKFPRGGAMGLLENNPDLIEKYSKVAHKFIELDYVAPMNVLWTYYFINGRHDEANPLWEKYVKDCPQIMFQKICQTARSRGSLDMASKLVDLLQDARVTSGAQGIAYSCLLDVMSQNGSYREALGKLEFGLSNGVKLDDVNRTALIRLKGGLEMEGVFFPYEIPKKQSSSGHHESSLSQCGDME